MKKLIVVVMILLAITGCATAQQKRPLLFVAYQGWLDEERVTYSWSTIEYEDEIIHGKQLLAIEEQIAKDRKYHIVIITNFRRLESIPPRPQK